MSVASEISRLQQAKADIKTAIEGKGVTVPSNATLDEYADLVDSISGSGDTTDYKALWIARLKGTLSGEVIIPEEVTSLVNQALSYNVGITSLKTIATSVIGESIFNNTTHLTVVDLCSTTTRIGWHAFTTVDVFICRATTPPTISSAAFLSAPSSIKVPASSVDAYKAASNWSTYASIITAIDE